MAISGGEAGCCIAWVRLRSVILADILADVTQETGSETDPAAA
jgi:hypothetical protein